MAAIEHNKNGFSFEASMRALLTIGAIFFIVVGSCATCTVADQYQARCSATCNGQVKKAEPFECECAPPAALRGE